MNTPQLQRTQKPTHILYPTRTAIIYIYFCLIALLGTFTYVHIKEFSLREESSWYRGCLLLCGLLGCFLFWKSFISIFRDLETIKNELKLTAKYASFGFVFSLTLRLLLVLHGNTVFTYHALGLWPLIIGVCLYTIFVFFQELVFRFFLQKCFLTLFKKPLAIGLTSILFALPHVLYGYELGIISFFFSCLLGFLYEKNHSFIFIFGLHLIVGITFFCFCKYDF